MAAIGGCKGKEMGMRHGGRTVSKRRPAPGSGQHRRKPPQRLAASLAGAPEGMYRPGLTRAASAIELSRFRQILLWPLAIRGEALDGAGPEGSLDCVREIVDLLKTSDKVWEDVGDLSCHAMRHGDPDLARPVGKGDDPLANSKELAERYGEFVYFHDFIQDNLFGTPPKAGADFRAVRLFRRTGRWRLKAESETDFTSPKKAATSGKNAPEAEDAGPAAKVWYAADIARFNLYVFSTGAVILALELDFGTTPTVHAGDPDRNGDEKKLRRPMTLADAETFIDTFRRVYVPYFSPLFTPKKDAKTGAAKDDAKDDTKAGADTSMEAERGEPAPAEREILGGEPLLGDGGGLGKANLVLRKVSILPATNAEAGAIPIMPFDANHVDGAYDVRKAYAAIDQRTGTSAAPLVFEHWKRLIAPLEIAGNTGNAEAVGTLRQIVDERVPAMSFIAVKSEAGLSDGDRLRAISRGDWMRLCFADSAGSDPLPTSHHFMRNFEAEHCYDRFFPSEAATGSSRYLFCGYHFAIVGTGWFTETVQEMHFRRHYFQMALATTMEYASLLATSSRVTGAVRRFTTEEPGPAGQRRLQAVMESIQRDFLQFTHLFRFTGMSNQIQPTEMLAIWRRVTGLGPLYEDVKREIEAATGFLGSTEGARQGRNGSRLNVIAAVGVVLGIAISLSGLASFLDPIKSFGSYFELRRWAALLGWCFLASLIGLAGHWLLQRQEKDRSVPGKPGTKRVIEPAWIGWLRGFVSRWQEDPLAVILGSLAIANGLGFFLAFLFSRGAG